MADLIGIGDAQVILLAVQLASDIKLDQLHQLAANRPKVLQPNVLYRILLSYLPVDAPLSQLIQLLENLQSNFLPPGSSDDTVDLSSVQGLGPLDANRRASSLRFAKLPRVSESLLTCFLVARAHQSEVANGDLPFILRLVEPFVDHDDVLRTWVSSKLLPLLRLQYEYYPAAAGLLTLRDMEQIQGTAGVCSLLQHTTEHNSGRDLRGIVAPWVYGENVTKRRKTGGKGKSEITSWADVNEWILDSSVNNLPLAAAAVTQWDGPRDRDLGGYGSDEITHEGDSEDEDHVRKYPQTALALIYSSEDTTHDGFALSAAVLERASTLAGLLPPDKSQAMPLLEELPPELASVTAASLLHNALLRPENVLTRPSTSAISFLEALLASLNLLTEFKIEMNLRTAAELCLLASEERQMGSLHRVLQQIPRMTNANIDWRATLAKLMYLRSWTGSLQRHSGPHGLLWKVLPEAVHEELFKTMLIANAYNTAIEIFFQEEHRLLQPSTLEMCVKAAIFGAYDNASNGNRTRGGMKRAYDLLKAFQPHFPESDFFREVDHLIAATHSLSYYQLTLQHGVPFQPVSIRIHRDPLSLLDKVLEQNPRAYTKVDDLQGIGVNIVLAGLPVPCDPDINTSQSLQTKLSDAEQRVASSAISSALRQDDFDTAYSYITTRLSPQGSPTNSDDTSWRAAYAAGRYQPPSTPQSSVARMANLSKRMDLLSYALSLCPSPDHLPEILDAWRKCEMEMDSLKTQEADEERRWTERSNTFQQTAVPGDFGGFEDRDVDIADTQRAMANRSGTRRNPVGYEDEAPMGLFEVARGAAVAIQKSAFPLRSSMHREEGFMATGQRSTSSLDDHRPESALSGGAERVRKRDMVSNAVTGGLLKGMSWALGAEPVPQQQQQQQQQHQEYDES